MRPAAPEAAAPRRPFLQKVALNAGTLPLPVRLITPPACGALAAAAMPPWCFWPGLFAGLGAFYVFLALIPRSRKAACACGWLFGFGYFTCNMAWVANALLVEGNEYAWAWPLAAAGLPALLAFFPALAAALVPRAFLSTLPGFLYLVLALTGAEWLRGHILTGLPWNLYGYAWTQTLPIAQLASVGGIYWLTLLTVAAAALPGFLLVWKADGRARAAALGCLLLLTATAYGWGAHRLDTYPAKKNRRDVLVRLVQPDIPQEDKWNPAKAGDNLDRLLSLSAAKPVNALFTTLIVWPETALTEFQLRDPAAAAALRAVLSAYEGPVYLLTGYLRTEKDAQGNRRYYNSLAVFGRDLRTAALFDKAHLVPFGEYMPLPGLDAVTGFTGFEKGPGPQTLSLPGVGSFSPRICYEIIFPESAASTVPPAGFVVNVTNDSWYGDSAGPRQHFAIARFRAIEEGIPVVRSANTGISGIIDPLGKIVHQNALFTAAGDDIPLPAPLPRPTTYTTLKDRIFFGNICLIVAIAILLQFDSIFRHPDRR